MRSSRTLNTFLGSPPTVCQQEGGPERTSQKEGVALSAMLGGSYEQEASYLVRLSGHSFKRPRGPLGLKALQRKRSGAVQEGVASTGGTSLGAERPSWLTPGLRRAIDHFQDGETVNNSNRRVWGVVERWVLGGTRSYSPHTSFYWHPSSQVGT